MGIILFISVDDLRPEIGCFGRQRLVTPNIDKLASRGVRFEHAYCQYPQCMPSRASVMAGKRPHEWCDRVSQLCGHSEPSLPAHFKSHGYDTVSVGKVYHRNYDDAESWTRLYDFTFRETSTTGIHGYCSGYQHATNLGLLEDFRSKISSGQPRPDDLPSMCEIADVADSHYPDNRVAIQAAEVIGEYARNKKDLFLAVGFYRPHLPWAVPRRYWDLYDRDTVELASNPFLPKDAIGASDMCDFMHYGEPEIRATYDDLGTYSETNFPVLTESKQRECVHGYWASVCFIDAQIGIVLDAVDRAGVHDCTTIVLWGDNGWHLGEHALWSKTTHFEESTRVPVIVADPRAVTDTSRGGVVSGLVELVDLYPTLCELAAICQPAHLDGQSFVELLRQNKGRGKPYVRAINRNGETVRSKRYRLTRYSHNPSLDPAWHVDRGREWELFDLVQDPSEDVNVAGAPEYAPALARMSEILVAGSSHDRFPVD